MRGQAAKVRPAEAPTRVSDLVPDPENRRKHNARNLGMVADALKDVGAARSIVIDEKNVILAGNGVTEAAGPDFKIRVVEAKGDEIIAVRRSGLTEEQKRRLAIYDNRAGELAEWNSEQLAADAAAGLDLSPWFAEDELEAMRTLPGGSSGGANTSESLVERFGVPPFSVLDARQGYWQDRKRAWLSLGIQSELGRGEGVHQYSEAATIKRQNGTLGHDGSKVLKSRKHLAPGGAPMPLDRKKVSPGGSPRPAMKQRKGQKTARGDGRGRVIKG